MAHSKNLIIMQRSLYDKIMKVLYARMFIATADGDTDNDAEVCNLIDFLETEFGDGAQQDGSPEE